MKRREPIQLDLGRTQAFRPMHTEQPAQPQKPAFNKRQLADEIGRGVFYASGCFLAIAATVMLALMAFILLALIAVNAPQPASSPGTPASPVQQIPANTLTAPR